MCDMEIQPRGVPSMISLFHNNYCNLHNMKYLSGRRGVSYNLICLFRVCVYVRMSCATTCTHAHMCVWCGSNACACMSACGGLCVCVRLAKLILGKFIRLLYASMCVCIIIHNAGDLYALTGLISSENGILYYAAEIPSIRIQYGCVRAQRMHLVRVRACVCVTQNLIGNRI